MANWEIVFSPTGGTKKVADIIVGAWSHDCIVVDLSDACFDGAGCVIGESDQVVVAMPSFGGRAPAVATERLKSVCGNNAACTLVCVYGNRAFEDTLAEMEDAAKTAGFNVVAGIAAIAEHSIMPQYATARPNAADKVELEGFARSIDGKTSAVGSIPGNRPYKKAGAGMVPKYQGQCSKCGACVAQCPVSAIDEASLVADSGACVGCMRCVRRCPDKARATSKVMTKIASLAIKGACSQPKRNEMFV